MAHSGAGSGAMPDFESEAIIMPQAMAGNEKTVREGFWRKLGRVMARIPFAEHAVAAFYCAFDSGTPLRARGILLAALAYFVMPIDFLPDALLGLGFTDDLTVLVTAISLVSKHITPEHYRRARETIEDMKRGPKPAGA